MEDMKLADICKVTHVAEASDRSYRQSQGLL